MSELSCTIKTEYRGYTGETEDVIEGVSTEGDQIKGPIPTRSTLPTKSPVVLLGDWRRNGSGKRFHFYAAVSPHVIDEIRSVQAILSTRGFRRTIPVDVVRDYPGIAADVIRRNPFILLPYKSASFDRCDQMWIDFGLPPDAVKRQVLFIADLLNRSPDGHVWFDANAISSAIEHRFEKPQFGRALLVGTRSNVIRSRVIGGMDGAMWLASPELADAEDFCATWLARRIRMKAGWPPDVADLLEDDQRAATRRATQGGVCSLLGGGGTGKTYTLSRMILKIGDLKRCCLCAPTGKAAVRMAQSVSDALAGTHLAKEKIVATTIHRLIALQQYRSSEDSYYERNRREPTEATYYFVDESSMLDIKIMARFLDLIPRNACVMFVGDPGQLPPVGPGAPLRDLIKCIPSGTITKTHRNDGLIQSGCQQIRDGQSPKVCESYDGKLNNLVHIDTDAPVDTLVSLIRDIAKDYDGCLKITMENCQVIGVVNRNSIVSVHSLNERIREVVNPGRDSEFPFRLDDKVVNGTNGYMIPERRYPHGSEVLKNRGGNVYVANGEQGRVVECTGYAATIELDCPSRRVRLFQKKILAGSEEGVTGTTWRHAYAITTHKSQGGQWPHVICMLDNSGSASRLLDRSLMYTMISRASQCCWLIGDYDVIRKSIGHKKIDQRKTFLAESTTQRISDGGD